jgi:hypothetical protein
MKVFLIILILLAAAGAVFWIGWLQLSIPAGTYAVIHTKTGGFEPQVVPSGVFVWRWERLLPTDLTLYTFSIHPVTVEVPPVKGELPSGEIYSSAMEGKPDFSYEIAFTLTVSVNPQSLPRLAAEQGLTPQGLDPWLRQQANAAVEAIASSLLADPLSYFEAGGARKLAEAAAQKGGLEDIVIDSLVPRTVRLPDRQLYEAARRKYLAMAATREAKDVEALRQEAGNLRMLQDYGELLNRYPVLLQYLYLQSIRGEDNRGVALGLLELLRAQPGSPLAGLPKPPQASGASPAPGASGGAAQPGEAAAPPAAPKR